MRFNYNKNNVFLSFNLPSSGYWGISKLSGLLFLLFSLSSLAQSQIRGVVLEENNQGQFVPLVGAPVLWLGTSEGTTTDTSGVFMIGIPEHIALGHLPLKLVVSYIGYIGDTLLIDLTQTKNVKVILAEDQSKTLKEVQITERLNSSFMNALEPLNTKTMSEKELFKAACCNLSESFETNPSVDVNFADAVTGAKQIQMLGLSGIYTQITNENLPGTRGLAANYGLGYIPGPWIESIQVTKGVGSVANGYESMAGQINVELKKTDVTPKIGERIYFNTYANDFGRLEANLNLTQKVSKNWANTTLLHVNTLNNKVDMNKDGFLDLPMGTQLNAINRWKYDNGRGFMFQVGIKAMKDERTGGQSTFSASNDKLTTNAYGLALNTQRLEAFTKIGYVFTEKKYKSIGLMASVLHHDQDNYYGLTTYKALQKTFYANLIYQSIIGNTNHKFRTGISQLIDSYDEQFMARATYNQTNLSYSRTEIVPGAFMEYTWTISPKLTTVAGLRGDYHNLFGFFVTPRIHAKYDLTEKTQFRASAGRGRRMANLLAENTSVFVSSRKPIFEAGTIPSTNGRSSNGLESAWNYGVSLSQDFRLNYRNGTLGLDFYRTDFQNQMVVDYDKNPQEINFTPLKGISYSNSAQAEINYELLKRLDMRLAYRWYDVHTTYHGQLLQRPLIAQDRAFINLAYETKSKWKFDYTLNWNGSKRITNTSSNPENFRKNNYSPDYVVMNAQISKSIGNPMKQWIDVYLGVENLTDFRQRDLIISADAPFSPYFDSSLVWGPVIGRMFYVGLRYKLK